MRKIGGYIPQWPGYSYEERLKLFLNAGFEFICYSTSDVFGEENFEEKRKLVEKMGLEVQNVHLSGPHTNDIWLKGEDGEVVTARYCNEIRRIAEIGVKVGIAHLTWGSRGGTPPDPTELGLQRLSTILETAEKCGVTLALENSVTSHHLTTVFEKLHSPAMGFTYDAGHRYCFTPEFDFVSRFGSKMAAMHMDDNEGHTDIHLLPFDGIADWNQVIHDLSTTSFYDKYVILEVPGQIHRKSVLPIAELKQRFAKTAMGLDDKLLTVYEGGYDVYDKLTFEEYLDRMHRAALKIAQREK